MKNTKINLRLPVTLTERELLAIQDEAVAVNKEIDVLDMQKKRLGAKAKERGERLQELFVLMDEKSERREVECQMFYEWNLGEKRLRRLDTFEQVGDTEIIQERERQMHFSETGEVAAAGFETDEGITETDEKARIPIDNITSNEVEKLKEASIPACETCEGDGFYNDEGGEEYCQCPAGEALKAKDEAKAAAKAEATYEPGTEETTEAVKCFNASCVMHDLAFVDSCSVAIDARPGSIVDCADYKPITATKHIDEHVAEQPLVSPIDKNRNCCMPGDRIFTTINGVQILYCKVCQLIHRKQDAAGKDITFIIGEKIDFDADWPVADGIAPEAA